jgi:hypothetical protein
MLAAAVKTKSLDPTFKHTRPMITNGRMGWDQQVAEEEKECNGGDNMGQLSARRLNVIAFHLGLREITRCENSIKFLPLSDVIVC